MNKNSILIEDNKNVSAQFNPIDLDKLDSDFKLIDNGELDVQLPVDTYDYSNHKWESSAGNGLGKLFYMIDNLTPEQSERMMIDDTYLESLISETEKN